MTPDVSPTTCRAWCEPGRGIHRCLSWSRVPADKVHRRRTVTAAASSCIGPVGTMARLIDAETARPEMASDRPPDHPYPYPVIVTLQTMAGWAAEHPDDDHSDHAHLSVRNPTRLPVS